MPHSPLNHYRKLVASGARLEDPHQLAAVEQIDALWRDLQTQRRMRLFDRLRGHRRPLVRGLYLWGGVGRGKTWLMDLFYQRLPGSGKQRVHFHRFMQRVHHELRNLDRSRDPLARIAADWGAHCRVLCLDEFFVSDIADAMLLAGLMRGLFEQGVTLVVTSNIEPDGLYRHGLQRARFLPAIELLKTHLRVVELPGDTDFRLRILERSEIYHHPLDSGAEQGLLAAFQRVAAECELNRDLDINGRGFHAHRRGDGVIWFEFGELCEKARGSIDYIEIARAFNTVVVSNVPRLGEENADAARRFITLVDEFYDRNVKLLVSAAAPPEELYGGNRLAFEFRRTTSRLTEMQSHDYLARPHLP